MFGGYLKRYSGIIATHADIAKLLHERCSAILNIPTVQSDNTLRYTTIIMWDNVHSSHTQRVLEKIPKLTGFIECRIVSNYGPGVYFLTATLTPGH